MASLEEVRIGWLELILCSPQLMSIFGIGIGRALSVSRGIEARLPSEPVWYHHYAGCAPSRQGSGLGGAVVRAGLDRICGAAAYLETAKEQNIVFYQRLGFAVTSTWLACRGGPRFWSMMKPQT